MGIRFESNYQRMLGIAPVGINDNDPLSRWFRVHEWQVDEGFESKLLMILLNVEPQFPTPVTVQYGWMRVDSFDTTTSKWETKFEVPMNSAIMSAKQFTPRLVIIPIGSGITFTANQGLSTKALSGVAASYRWWSCYVIDAQAV